MKKIISRLLIITCVFITSSLLATPALAGPNKGDPSPESFPVVQYTLKQDIL